jgi:hypothetical protein
MRIDRFRKGEEPQTLIRAGTARAHWDHAR